MLKKIILIFILFISIVSFSFAEEVDIEINPLTNTWTQLEWNVELEMNFLEIKELVRKELKRLLTMILKVF